MCQPDEDKNARRAQLTAELIEACARAIRASATGEPDQIERASNAMHNMAYDLEQQSSINENEG